jgi:hypothetical protein
LKEDALGLLGGLYVMVEAMTYLYVVVLGRLWRSEGEADPFATLRDDNVQGGNDKVWCGDDNEKQEANSQAVFGAALRGELT